LHVGRVEPPPELESGVVQRPDHAEPQLLVESEACGVLRRDRRDDQPQSELPRAIQERREQHLPDAPALEPLVQIDRVLAGEAPAGFRAHLAEVGETGDFAIRFRDQDRLRLVMLGPPGSSLGHRPRLFVPCRDACQNRVVVDAQDGWEIILGGKTNRDGGAHLHVLTVPAPDFTGISRRGPGP
jgi:hypothetical protein